MMDTTQITTYRPWAGRPRSFDGNVKYIASAAHLRGVILIVGQGETRKTVGSVEAADLCRMMRTAHEATRGDHHRHTHATMIAFRIALYIGAQGPVAVSRTDWNVLKGYAARAKMRQ